MKKKNRKRMIFGIAGILFMAGAVIGIIGVLEKGEKEQKQTRTKTDTIETASELEQEKGMPTGSDDEKVKTETTPKGTEEEVTAVTERRQKISQNRWNRLEKGVTMKKRPTNKQNKQ